MGCFLTYLYPNLIRIYGYSSRNQKDKDAYVDVLNTRLKAKHKELSQEFLDKFGVTMDDVNKGLKLPINAYSGALRAKFNALYDPLQGTSICFTGQLLLLQLAHDILEVPTTEVVSLNTDAIMYMCDEEYEPDVETKIHEWEKLTGLEMEQDKIVKIIMRDVNNYVEILKTGDNDYDVHYKGGCFPGIHNFKWNKETKKFDYSFEIDIKNNSLTICAEAMLKELLFNIPCEETINNCNDIFRFQMISHLGSTYEKCVLEYKDGRQETLQRNNRIYAGKEKNNAKVYKIKGERKDSLANCPPNPIIDNKNDAKIEDINKNWYIKYTKQKIADFIGKREVHMDEKLDKLKKDELVALLKEAREKEEDRSMNTDNTSSKIKLEQKIQAFRVAVREHNFILDKQLPSNLGSGEYYSPEQIYDIVQETCLAVGLDFKFETVDVIGFDIGAFKPSTGAPQNIATVKCIATFTDIETGLEKTYTMISQGSDSIDKAVSGATSYAFRNWFDKNFTPCIFNGERIKFGDEDSNVTIDNVPQEMAKSKPKTPVYVAPEKKKEIVDKITSEPQKTNDKSDADKLIDLIYEYRELSGDQDYASKSIQTVLSGNCDDVWIMSATLKVQNRLDDLKKEKGE